jgi:hypothetical protein
VGDSYPGTTVSRLQAAIKINRVPINGIYLVALCRLISLIWSWMPVTRISSMFCQALIFGSVDRRLVTSQDPITSKAITTQVNTMVRLSEIKWY